MNDNSSTLNTRPLHLNSASSNLTDNDSFGSNDNSRLKELNIHPNLISIDLDLDETALAWFTQLKKYWTLCKYR